MLGKVVCVRSQERSRQGIFSKLWVGCTPLHADMRLLHCRRWHCTAAVTAAVQVGLRLPDHSHGQQDHHR
jgi:hypothetical protein